MLHNHIVSAIALWLALTLPAGAAEPPDATTISAEPEAAVQWLSTLPPPDMAETVTPSATPSAETLTPEQSPAVDASADVDSVDTASDNLDEVSPDEVSPDEVSPDEVSLDEVNLDQGDGPASLSELLISGASTIQPILASLAATHQAQGGAAIAYQRWW